MANLKERPILTLSQFVIGERVWGADSVCRRESCHHSNLMRVCETIRACIPRMAMSLEETDEGYPVQKVLESMGKLPCHSLVQDPVLVDLTIGPPGCIRVIQEDRLVNVALLGLPIAEVGLVHG